MDVALITGGSRGLGLELTKLFLKDKIRVLIIARDSKRLNLVKKELESFYKTKVYILSKDLRDEKSYNEIYSYVKENKLNVKYLINNAGLGTFGTSHVIDMKDDIDMIKTNIIALMSLTKLFSKNMVKRKEGYILNISSLGGFLPGPYISTYYASKSFVLSFSEAISVELKKFNIKVSVLCVGPMDTGFQSKAGITKNMSSKLFIKNPEKVALQTYKSLKKGKTIVIPGILEKTLVFSLRFMPRKLIRRLSILSQNNKASRF